MRKFFALLVALVCCLASATEIPREAYRYQRDLIREARAVQGLTAPVAVYAAQIHQESRWRRNAMSHVGARGMAQFMPGTERWIERAYPELASDDGGAMNPIWAIRALIRYDDWLIGHLPDDKYKSIFDAVWATLRSYNGGLGHWIAEANNAKSSSREDIDDACGTARRHRSHCKENLGYPRRILIDLQPLYASWGPGVEP